MLRYFRINDPYRLLGLLLLFLFIWLPIFIDPPQVSFPELKSLLIGERLNEGVGMYSGVADNTAPLAAWFMELTDSLFGRSVFARHVVAFILIFLQGVYVGIMFITRKVFNENTYIPALLFCVLSIFSYDVLTFSGELLGLTFLLLALNNLFKEIEFRVQRDETIFNLGLFISLASLFSFAYFIYLLCAVVVLFFFTRTPLRKFLLLVFGFLLPHLLVITLAYTSDTLSKLWEYYYVANLRFTRQTFISFQSLIVLAAVPLFYFVISVFMLQREARFSKYQSQLLQTMFLWIGFSFIYLFYCKSFRPQNLIVFIPAFAFLFSHFFLFIRRKRYAEMNIWILLIGLVSVSYFARYNKLGSVKYSSMIVPAVPEGSPVNKRILVLENDLAQYSRNRLATPYLNWGLSENVFRNPDYYENLTEVYHWFSTDPPHIILDRENLLKPFLDKMPEIRKRYVRNGNLYTLTTSN